MAEPELPPFPLPPDKWQEIAKQLKLSPRQVDVVALVLRRRCYKQIETSLNMAHGTLRIHMERVFEKASVSNREELILHLFALSHDICPPLG